MQDELLTIAAATFAGMVIGYVFRGRENDLIRATVNDAMAVWTKAHQDAQKLYQDLQAGATGVMKKL